MAHHIIWDGGIVGGQSGLGVEEFMLVLALPAAEELTHRLVLIPQPQAEGIEAFGLVVHIESVHLFPATGGRALPVDPRNGLACCRLRLVVQFVDWRQRPFADDDGPAPETCIGGCLQGNSCSLRKRLEMHWAQYVSPQARMRASRGLLMGPKGSWQLGQQTLTLIGDYIMVDSVNRVRL